MARLYGSLHQMSLRSRGTTWSLLSGVAGRVRAAGRVLLALVRELADENAYARHLAVHGRAHSPEEWRRFSDVRLRRKFQQGRCC